MIVEYIRSLVCLQEYLRISIDTRSTWHDCRFSHLFDVWERIAKVRWVYRMNFLYSKCNIIQEAASTSCLSDVINLQYIVSFKVIYHNQLDRRIYIYIWRKEFRSTFLPAEFISSIYRSKKSYWYPVIVFQISKQEGKLVIENEWMISWRRKSRIMKYQRIITMKK